LAADTWSPGQASIRQLLARVADEGRALLGDVSRLVGAEARGRLADLRLAVVLLAAAGGALFVGLVIAGGAAVAALARVMPLWAAALAVAAAVLGLGVFLGRLAVARLRRMWSRPDQTLELLADGVRWLRGDGWPREASLSRAARILAHLCRLSRARAPARGAGRA
jgi:hypothetical protein